MIAVAFKTTLSVDTPSFHSSSVFASATLLFISFLVDPDGFFGHRQLLNQVRACLLANCAGYVTFQEDSFLGQPQNVRPI